MATPEQVAALRLLIAESDELNYTDTVLGDRLDAVDANGDLVAYQIWTEKAAGAATLVDISEGGSSRKMGDIYEQALSMAETFRVRATSPTVPPDGNGSGMKIRKLTRP